MCGKCNGHNSGIADDVATGIGGLHKAADALFWPLKPVDDVIHGVARGAFNWLVDEHPDHRASSHSHRHSPQPPHMSTPSCTPGRGYPSQYPRGGGYPHAYPHGGGYPNQYPHGGGYPNQFPHGGGYPYPHPHVGAYPAIRDKFSGNDGRNIGNGNVNNEGGGSVKDSGKVYG